MTLPTRSDGPFGSLSAPTHQPIRPTLVIEPTGKWSRLNLRELWDYRELLYFLVWRDLKVRYKQTALGVMWVILQPLVTTLVFTIVFGNLARIPSGNLPYVLFAFAGLLPWTYFASTVNRSGTSLVNNAHLLTKIYFPRLIIPLAGVINGLVDFSVSFTVLLVFASASGVGPFIYTLF